jgi:hypothetical protein
MSDYDRETERRINLLKQNAKAFNELEKEAGRYVKIQEANINAEKDLNDFQTKTAEQLERERLAKEAADATQKAADDAARETERLANEAAAATQKAADDAAREAERLANEAANTAKDVGNDIDKGFKDTGKSIDKGFKKAFKW